MLPDWRTGANGNRLDPEETGHDEDARRRARWRRPTTGAIRAPASSRRRIIPRRGISTLNMGDVLRLADGARTRHLEGHISATTSVTVCRPATDGARLRDARDKTPESKATPRCAGGGDPQGDGKLRLDPRRLGPTSREGFTHLERRRDPFRAPAPAGSLPPNGYGRSTTCRGTRSHGLRHRGTGSPGEAKWSILFHPGRLGGARVAGNSAARSTARRSALRHHQSFHRLPHRPRPEGAPRRTPGDGLTSFPMWRASSAPR